MRALLVQPPFVQLNAPYPAVHYLDSFLRSRGIEARSADHSIELYRAVFSREGLVPAFEAARHALERASADLDPAGRSADRASRSSIDRGSPGSGRDVAAARELERYLSYEGLYLEWIDGIIAFLSGEDPSFAHRLAQAVELPLGSRASAFLDARDRRIGEAEAPALATAILGDLGDLVAYALDPSFATVRYGERIAASAPDFGPIRSALESSPLLESAYGRLLSDEWRKQGPELDLLLIAVPFPGCLLGALACARSARSAYGGGTRILIGGGYVSTELRGLRDPGIFDFCDYLCFDSGYGSIASILEVEAGAPPSRLYRTMYRGEGGVVAAGFGEEDEAGSDAGSRRTTRCDEEARIRAEEDAAIRDIAPDYSGLDFGRYLRIADSGNPMHRLWNDSPWLKYRLAHGCYWRRCAFCDTELEYVSRYLPARLESIIEAADEASERTGLYGIHFVDEAMPMGALLAFASANRARARAGKRPFRFWGNVRFDSGWTEDRCEYLAASGLVAVSGGIEIATERGLAMTCKGFDLEGLARTLVAMKRAGLLTHAYLIYGFPGQSRRDILESAEFCRGLFASGLADSAFWHRFVLTRHSRMHCEWRKGERPGLEPIDRPREFADNDLGFAGERAYDDLDGPLAAALEAWMSGDCSAAVEAAGARKGEGSGPALVEELIARAERALDEAKAEDRGSARWIAGSPILRAEGRGKARFAWAYRGETISLSMERGCADRLAGALRGLAEEGPAADSPVTIGELKSALNLPEDSFRALRDAGLVGI